jgi:TRAP-type uncharacterized transport system fused permease subunit
MGIAAILMAEFLGVDYFDVVARGSIGATKSVSAHLCSWLVALMATIFLAPMLAALYMFSTVAPLLFRINVVPLIVSGRWSFSEFIKLLRNFIDSFTDVTLLLATLSVMTGALVITCVPTKLGALLVGAAGVNPAAMVAIVIGPAFMKVGANP